MQQHGPDLFNELFFSADEQRESSLYDFDLLDEMLLCVIVNQVALNPPLSA